MTRIDLDKSKTFHILAKDAGNRLRSYILSVSSGGAGVLFFSLTSDNADNLSQPDRFFLFGALISFFLTVIISLAELHFDSQRFFSVAKQHEKIKKDRDWTLNEILKKVRCYLMYLSYLTLFLGILSSGMYLFNKLF